jgi:multicomponent Na+:H+ antiporter subunit E
MSVVISRILRLASFVVFYIGELVEANFRLFYDILRPGNKMKPGIIAVSLDVHTDLELIMLTNLITMTPGTLSLDVSEDRRILFVHALYADDPEALKVQIKDSLENRVQEVFQ